MLDIRHLLLLTETLATVLQVEEKTISYRLFGDSKKIAALRGGADINVGRFNAALQWLSDHWPENAIWPDGVDRPVARIPEAAE